MVVKKPEPKNVDIICVTDIKDKVLYADFEENYNIAFVTKFLNHIEQYSTIFVITERIYSNM